ncbi:LysR family transcriptional regulator [soil metagenome]
MELRHLKHFIVVAEELNFTRAAERVHIVQSALSTSVRALEDELQARLFVRSNKKVQLTPAGRAFLSKAREVLRVVESGRETVAEIEGLRSGTLSIGTVHSLPMFLDLPTLISRYHAINPGIEVRLRQGDTASLIEQLRTGRLDLAFLPLLDPPEEILTGIIACEDLVAVLPKSHALAGQKDVPLRDLVTYPFVDFEIGWGTRPLVDRAFGQAGLHRRTVFDVTDLETVIDLVGLGLGIALLPETIAELRQSKISVCELCEPAICWELVVAHQRSEGNTPINSAANAFLGLLTFQ